VILKVKLLTVKETAEILRIKPSTIYSWAASSQIPCFKINGLLRFSEDDIIKWVSNCKKTLPERYNNGTGRRPRKGGQR
jgi:excisionase family DNA binding protein